MRNIDIRWHTSLVEIKKQHWDTLMLDGLIPFYGIEWLKAVENSESISRERGWQPIHLSIWRDENLVGFAPLYLKVHSYGEFIFDQVFERLAEDLDLNYFPKIIGMSPFSPIEGYRFFYGHNEDILGLTKLMLKNIDDFACKNKILSCNFLYIEKEWGEVVEELGYASWLNQKSILNLSGIKNFSDYLSKFNSNQRRNIKRERQALIKERLSVDIKTGCQVDKEILIQMHRFYEKHCSKWGLWGSKYLSERFFMLLASPQFRDQLVLFSAHRENSSQPIAMSFCITNGQMLWGRYWGSDENIDCLHFELCYYAPISWAIENGIQGFDPGAGGAAHKSRRGFHSVAIKSLHRWYDLRMDALIRQWLPRANTLTLQEIGEKNKELPFKSIFLCLIFLTPVIS